MIIYKTILFDLDDTIFDHQYSRRCALSELNKHYNLTDISMQEFEKVHQHYLDLTYSKVLEKKISMSDSRRERMSLLFNYFGCKANNNDVLNADEIYRSEYNKNRRSVPGVNKLIDKLKKYSKIAVITNGLRVEQDEKIRICNVEKDIDYSNFLNCDEIIKTILDVNDFVKKLGGYELLLLVNVRNSYANEKMVINALKNNAAIVKPYVKKAAVVGVAFTQEIILTLVNMFSNLGIKPFDTFDDAKDWLIE